MKYLLTILAILEFINCYSQSALNTKDDFELAGSVKGKQIDRIIISYVDAEGSYRHDTSRVLNGLFLFKGKIKGATPATIKGNILSRSMSDPNFADIYLEPGNLTIELRTNDFKKHKLTGSKTHIEKGKFDIQTENLQRKIGSLYEQMIQQRNLAEKEENAGNKKQFDEKARSLLEQLEKQQEVFRIKKLDFIRGNAGSCYSATLLFYISDHISDDTLKLYYSKFTKTVKECRMGINLDNLISKKNNTKVGNKAPDFSIKDLNGNLIRLSTYENKKNVILEFWASWCSPCRAGFPFLKTIHNQFGNEELEIIAISLDYVKEDWLKAIVVDSIGHWQHCSNHEDYKIGQNGMFTINELNNKYYVPAIPVTILINKRGIIEGFFKGKSEENDLRLKELLKQMLPH